MQNWKIASRLAAVLGLVVALTLLVAATALWQMSAMRDATREITQNWLPSVEHVNQMNTGLSDFRIAQFSHVLASESQGRDAAEKSMATVLKEFAHDHDVYVKLVSSPEEQRLYDTFAAGWKAYLAMHEKLLALSRQGHADEARTLLEGQGGKDYELVSTTLDKLAELNSAGADEASKASEQAFSSARTALLAAVVVALLAAVAAGVWLSRSISAPLHQALQVADRVAGGDLSGSIEVRTHDETGQLLRALQRMQTALVDVVSDVRRNSEGVATASAQIAQGNQDLSGRTERQASALQQTAATMEELGTTVRHNADSARQANQLAQGASGVAARGGEVVGRVVATMREIQQSSGRIADIIATIDGIAFQTNILALNAAVEAARAGEQGRGFAVVAGEVRSLAQRCAEAAREIRTLISRSVEQVEAGTGLVDQAGQTMSEIVGAIQRVSDIVGEISAASTEQSTGVQQVGQSVSEMDQATQQNAALVEEGAAAAESLKQQAQGLVQSVAAFRLA